MEGDDRAEGMVVNYFLNYGAPKELRDVVLLGTMVFRSAIAWAVADGVVELTDKGRASDKDEAASRNLFETYKGAETALDSLLAGQEATEDSGFRVGSYL